MDRDSRRTTIYDLAQLAGASPSAVSAILNGTWQKRRISLRLAERVKALAEEQGYAVNSQASLLRRERSHIVGMIVPKYDNRYFGQIAERFEARARAAGFFPVVTCTQRDPEMEFEAAKELVSWQAECVIATGATDPDRISGFCAAAGVQSINLDLPGTAAPSVISDNFAAAQALAAVILDRCDAPGPLRFVGGRPGDHNTAARLRGFLAEHDRRGIAVPEDHRMMPGYSADKVAQALAGWCPKGPVGLFVNSTIALEGVVRWIAELPQGAGPVRYGCFDWDAFAARLPGNVGMVEQDVGTMLTRVFDMIGARDLAPAATLVPCLMRCTG